MTALAVVLVLLAAVGVAALSSAERKTTLAHNPTVTAHSRPTVNGSKGAGKQARALTPLQRRESRAIDTTLRYTHVMTAGSRRHREVALTFDDGPSVYTDAVLRILKHKHVPATFFVVGQQLNRFAPRMQHELRQRMPVGDHTESHAWLTRLDPRGQSGQIADAALRISQQGAPFPRLFRPPYGAFNRTTLKTLRRLRMLLVLWSIDPGDWRRPGVGPIVNAVLSKARPGAIVLLHDGGGYRDQTVAALPSIIDGLRRRHYQLVTVPRLIMDDPPPRHQRLPRFTGA